MKFHIHFEKKNTDGTLEFGGVFKFRNWKKAILLFLEMKDRLLKKDLDKDDTSG